MALDEFGSFATGWMIADALGWGQKKNKNGQRENRTWKIGRNFWE
ncbi:hypothetical protein [Paucilactobacillus sp. N302-9]